MGSDLNDDDGDCCAGAKKRIELPPFDTTLLSKDFAQERYNTIVQEGPCCYNNEELGLPLCHHCPCGGTIFPILCPQAVCAPCCIFGKIISVMQNEVSKLEELARIAELRCSILWLFILSVAVLTQISSKTFLGRNCGLGPQGMTVSLAICPMITITGCACSLGAMILTATQRKHIITRFGLRKEGSMAMLCSHLCYPCALWRHMVFLSEMSIHAARNRSDRWTPRGEDMERA